MKIKISVLLLILIIGCKQKETADEIPSKNFNLSGTISGGYDDYIFLGYGKHTDSTKVIDGNFKFSGELDLPTQQGWLNLRPYANSVFVYLESSDIKLTADFYQKDNNGTKINILDLKDIQGSKTAVIQDNYREFWTKNKDKENFNSLLYQEVKKLFKENPKHSFSGKILGDLASSSPILKVSELENLYSLIDTSYQNKFDLQYYQTGIKSLKKYNVGNAFVSFSLPNQNSELINIKDYKGKYTLVDFWASWCKPCRVKHPKLIELYNSSDKETFDIISVSIDENEENWKNAIEQDELIWANVIDTESKISHELGVQAIPYNYLLNPEGEIIGVNLPIDQIQTILKEKTSG